MKAIKDMNLNILHSRNIRTTWGDDSHVPEGESKNAWWNGIYVAILQKPSK
jgi:hypothetical protein